MVSPEPYDVVEDEIREYLDVSLEPRGPEMLFDYVADARIGVGSLVLDLGCNTGRFSFELRDRFGCDVVGVDNDEDTIDHARRSLGPTHSGVTFASGSAESIPLPDDSVDFVWCRDVLELVADLDATYREIHRVLRPGARAVIYTMCATDDLEIGEARALYAGFSDVVPSSMSRDNHVASIARAGFTTLVQEELGSEWGECDQERTGKPARSLLQVARLRRGRDAFVARYGELNYDIALTDRLWHVYRMMGKLTSCLFVLEKNQTGSTTGD